MRVLAALSYFLATLNLILPQAARADQCAPAQRKSPVASLDEASRQLLAEDIRAFCEKSMGGGREFLLTHDLRGDLGGRLNLSKMSEKERARFFEDPKFMAELVSKGVSFQGTTLNQIPNKDIRSLEFVSISGKSIDFYLDMIRNADSSLYDGDIDTSDILKTEPTTVDLPGYDSIASESSLKLSMICGLVSPLLSVECSGNLKKILGWSSPKLIPGTATNIMLVDLYQKVIRGKEYVAGLGKAAQSIAGKFKSERVESGGSLFSDIKGAFRSAGDNEKTAEDKAFDVLGLIATAGANLNGRFEAFDPSSVVEFKNEYSLSVIALAMPKLDSVMLEKFGRPYSLPPEVKSSCDTGKLYHFWLSAYFAHRLVSEGSSPRAAALAAFLSEKGYQILSKTYERDPNRVFEQNSYSDWNNMMRADLSTASAGATFGAAKASGKSVAIDSDAGLRAIIWAGEFLPPLTSAEAQDLWIGTGLSAYWRFEKIMAPDEAIRTDLNLLSP